MSAERCELTDLRVDECSHCRAGMMPTPTDDADVFAGEFDDIRDFLRVHEPSESYAGGSVVCLGCDEVTRDCDYSEHLVRIMRRTMVLRTPEQVAAQPDGSVIVTLEGHARMLDAGSRVPGWPTPPVLLVWKPEANG